MENYFVYILISKTINRFYIGSTAITPDKRLERHLSEYYGSNKFTAKAKDWKLFFAIKCISLKQATHIEKHIKNMKSKIYIENLKKYPDITIKLTERYPP